ncbi:uncharacterized protein (TIGR02679 family) [Halopolyspora algeriensis]|uniref:Uncharacterized protein (TIGR02679 family) n=1 Tax=Halopolyspora algeriensis TaxID=1500506 RepID=A0A368VLZ4_9ACTN|nr:TIGR02679 family protein [Halopolyspora algeriensis]RCW40706.1 uncharacterized protein (TIGR02679 family) [Halopolyspora algeriensis]TQM53371.1 uncharacterized protein (TIGR02679 family) [Halopolyspora algeriensis]
MDGDEDIRAAWDTAELRGLWAKAREVLEAPEQPATFRLELPDEATRQAVGEVYGRPMWGQGTRISVSRLDAALRENTRFGLGLEQVLEVLHGRPVGRRESSTGAHTERHDRVTEVLGSALSRWGLAEESWARPWVQWLRQYGRVADDELEQVAERSAAVLAHMVLDPGSTPRRWRSRAELATRFGGGARLLDSGMTLSRTVLRAAAIAHDVESPGNERDRRKLWELCGVTPDAVSTTALCWALPVTDSGEWSQGIRQRTALGLPVQLTHLDLQTAPEHLVEAGTTVAVCENPRVLEAAAQEGIRHPLVCTSGHPATVVTELLHRLSACGAVLRYHGDFDWMGLTIARSLRSDHDVGFWRMAAADYRAAVNLASAQRIDLPVLTGEPSEAPWDPELPELMATAGRAVEEEVVLDELLADLRTGLG